MMSQGTELVASCGGVAFAFLLVMFFSAVFSGESERITAYPTNVNADVWVMQKGVANMHMAMSQLWDWKEGRIRSVEGVRDTESILYLNAVFDAGGRVWFAYVVGLAGETNMSGPWAMHSGRRMPAQGEAVIPRILAELTGLQTGDTIEIVDRRFTIVGQSIGTFSMANSIVFVSRRDLAEIMSAEGLVSYVMVRAAEGVNSAELARRIESQVDKINALPGKKFIQNDHHMAIQMGVEIVALMSMIGSLLAMIIVAFTAHAFIVRRKRELAIIKSLGYRNIHVYYGVLVQTLLLTLAGLGLALVFALILFPLITWLVPAVSLKLTLASLIKTALMALLAALLAALWPARQIARVDPLTVFHG